MKIIVLFCLFQTSFLIGFSQTDSTSVAALVDTVVVINKNEIGVDISPVFIKSMNLDRIPNSYSKTHSFNLFYKRHIGSLNYLRIGLNVIDRSIYNPYISSIYTTTYSTSPIFQSSFYAVKSQDVYVYAGYEKRFNKHFIQPFMSVDILAGKFHSNVDHVIYNLNDTLYPISYSAANYDSTVVYTSGATSLVKYQNSTSSNYVTVGLLFKAGFTVDLTKRLYLLMQTGGSVRMLFGDVKVSYPSYDPSKDVKNSMFNFDLLQNQTNLMIGYRF